jgi:serine/threonine-protein kinase
VPDELARAVAGRYVIERELGRGGMATVYLAHDLRHDRQVALKVLRPELSLAIGAERFLAEIRTTARLQHQHILPLFDSGVAEVDGQRSAVGRRPSTVDLLYYVMPYVTGETLRERLAREGPLAPGEVARLIGELSSALDYSHRQGIIHRDIKPANVLIHEGSTLLADFGIARVASSPGDERLTDTGLSIGTPQYMSPEQASGGREIGPASDQYSLAVVAYELLTGRLPFSGATLQAMVVQLFTTSPAPPTDVRPDLPAAVNAVVLRALGKDPASRFANCGAFAAALRHATSTGITPAPTRVSVSSFRRHRGVAVLVAVALLAGFGAWFTLRRPAGKAAAPHLVAVLPLVNLSGDTAREYFGRGLALEITDELHRLGINVVGSAAATAAAHRFTTGSDVDVQAAGRSLRADAVLGGALLPSATGGRVRLDLTDVRSQELLWTDEYRLEADLFAMQDSVARAVARSLRVTLHPSDLAAVQRGRSVDPVAHDQVVRAKGYADRRDEGWLDQAIPLFSAAIGRDSTYAEAWAGLAEAYFLNAIFFDRAQHDDYFRRSAVAAARAQELDGTSAAVHRVLGELAVFHSYDWETARREFEASLALDSTQAATWLFRTWYYYGMNHLDSAVWSARRAWQLDSLTPIYPTRLADVLRDAGDTAEAQRILEHTLRLNRTDPIPLVSYAGLLAERGQCDSALKLPLPPLPDAGLFKLEVLARCGRAASVRVTLDSAEDVARRGGWAPGVGMAMGAGWLHDTARTERWLDYVATSRDWMAFYLRAPVFAEYRDNPHYRAALQSFGLK